MGHHTSMAPKALEAQQHGQVTVLEDPHQDPEQDRPGHQERQHPGGHHPGRRSLNSSLSFLGAATTLILPGLKPPPEPGPFTMSSVMKWEWCMGARWSGHVRWRRIPGGGPGGL